jgi:hypothetical protein
VARPEATAPLTIDMQPAQQQQQQQEQQQHQEEDREGVGWVPGASREHVLYASLPQEASCTENLTPWLKLLPCRWGLTQPQQQQQRQQQQQNPEATCMAYLGLPIVWHIWACSLFAFKICCGCGGAKRW